MKRIITILTSLTFMLCLSASAWAAAADMTKDPGYLNGEKLFKQNCASCHMVDKKMTGPALRGITQRHSEAWLLKWIKNSQAFIKTGDPDAVKLFDENNHVVMTPMEHLSEADIKNVITYVENVPAPKPAVASTPSGDTNQSASGPGFWTFVILGILLFALLNLMISIEDRVSRLAGKPVMNWNFINAILFPIMLVAGTYYIWHYFDKYSSYTYFAVGSGSEHGKALDEMFMVTLVITGIVFILCQAAAFIFPYLYRFKGPGTKGFYFPDNHKLEFIWTIIPTIVIMGMLVYGLKQWNGITMGDRPDNAYEVELYARQFDWTARYPGADGKLGSYNYHNIAGANTTGLNYEDATSHDDITNIGEIHFVVDKPVVMHMRAQDVIHSAYIPNLRVQMNVVPGMPTSFTFTPTVTSREMRERLQKEHPNEDYTNWDYMLLCNKICGNSHYQMKMKVVVESKAEYNIWLKGLKAPYTTDHPDNTAPADSTVKKTTAYNN
jgi:cytochrome c oxidase subunit 2